MSYNFSSEYLDEIVINIITRLPLESLSRFKRVCKLWHYAISHPNFLLKRESLLLISLELERDKCPSLYSIDTQSFIYSHPVPWKQKKPWEEHNFSYERVFITNSCDGLVLIGLDTNLFLFNPSTNYFIKVLELHRLKYDGYSVTAGFCYDYSINDYKAVLGLVHESPDYGGAFVIVASLRTKKWKEFRFPFDLGSADAGPVVNGRMHWTVRHPSKFWFSKAREIIHFDSRSNIFEEFLMPRPKHGDENGVVGLGVLDGQLCMARGDVRDEMGYENKFRSIEVLVMKEYGVVESWTSLFVVSNSDLMVNLYYGRLTPLIFTENGEVLLKIDKEKLVLYNHRGNSYRNVRIPERDYYVEAVSLDVSLVEPTDCRWSRRKHRRLGSRINYLRKAWDSDSDCDLDSDSDG
ncbi:hypothetical protein LguiA_001496 [Lonicera macranthoides]